MASIKKNYFSEQELEGLIRSLDDFFMLLDNEGNILKYSQPEAFQEVFKWSDDYLGKKFHQACFDDLMVGKIKEGIGAATEMQGIYKMTFLYEMGHQQFWFSANFVKRFDDAGFIITGRNVTDERQKQQDLEKHVGELENLKKAMFNILEDMENERKNSVVLAKDLEKFKLAVEFSFDHIQIIDTDQNVIYMNQAGEKITGFSRKESIGKKIVNLWRAMDQPAYKKLWQSIHNQKKPFLGEIVNRRKNGEEYPAEVQIYPLLDKRGEIMFYVGIEKDITKLKEVDKMKSEFISVASHQLRTPLSGIKWLTEILLGGKVGELKKEQLEILNEIKESNERLIALVNDLLNVSHIETGSKFIIERKPTDLVAIIKTVLGEQIIIAQQKNIQFDYIHQMPQNLMINIDGEKIRQVILNFINNAIKYADNNTKIFIDLQNKDQVVFRVQNFGILISEEEGNKLYQKFYRADSAKAMDPGGSGLGLYIAKAIVEGHGGEIWFTSSKEEGTSFYFSLKP